MRFALIALSGPYAALAATAGAFLWWRFRPAAPWRDPSRSAADRRRMVRGGIRAVILLWVLCIVIGLVAAVVLN
jgi:hypothetical protein